ncbi:hypothetical protein [Corynebacterium doosanense]|nr:hypothetical protein [Corynebacterium doosanense]
MNRRLSALVLASTLPLAACQQQSPSEHGPEQVMGNATPAASPAEMDPEGEVIEIGEVTDLVRAGDTLAARVGDELLTGTLAQFRSGSVDSVDAAGCTDVTATGENIVLTCGSEARVLGGETVSLTAPAQTAVLTSSGEIIAAPQGTEDVQVYRDGELAEEFAVAGTTDELLALPREGREDAVVRLNRSETRVQDLRWQDGEQGGTLRAGLGAGSMGGMGAGSEGIAVVSDTIGHQIMIYTLDDVIRLQQTAPTPESPWAAAWDGHLAWVASTATNTATGYDISGGVPVEESHVATIADVRQMVATDDGLVLGGARGLQIIPTER